MNWLKKILGIEPDKLFYPGQEITRNFEEKFTKSHERTKEMYQILGFMDSVMEEVTVEDLIPVDRMDQIKIVDNLLNHMYKEPFERLLELTYQYPLILPVKGEQIEMIVTFKKPWKP